MKFYETLENFGEYFFSQGSMKKDYELITNVLQAQGYWAGTEYRLYFDNDWDLIKVENRW